MAALPGEPAFGPPAFMHRMSTMDLPGSADHAPLVQFHPYHFRRADGGSDARRLKFEGSRFHGREPDEQRYDIETGAARIRPRSGFPGTRRASFRFRRAGGDSSAPSSSNRTRTRPAGRRAPSSPRNWARKAGGRPRSPGVDARRNMAISTHGCWKAPPALGHGPFSAAPSAPKMTSWQAVMSIMAPLTTSPRSRWA